MARSQAHKLLLLGRRGQKLAAYLDTLLASYGGVYWPFQETSGTTADAINTALATGRDVTINGDFANWTGDDPDDWNVTGEVGADPEVSEVGSGEGHGGAGTGACNFYSSATGQQPRINQNILTVGKTYTASVTISNRVSGSIFFGDGGGQFSGQFSAIGTHTFSWTAANTNFYIFGGDPAPNDVTVSSVSVKQTGISANDANMDGSVTSATVGQAGPGKGGVNYAVLYDATNDYTDLYSPELNSHWNPAAWSFGIFGLSDTWAAGTDYLGILRVDANNLIQIYRDGTDLIVDFIAGGTSESVTIPSGSPTGWFLVGLDSDGSNIRAIYNGAQSGSDQSIAGTFVGNFASTTCCIGAASTTPANVLDGKAHTPFLARGTLALAEWLKMAQIMGVA